MGKFITIKPCRGRVRMYFLDLAYFEWNLKNLVELFSVQLLINLIANKPSAESEGSIAKISIITKDVMQTAHILLYLCLLRKMTISALILLAADDSLIKEILSFALRPRPQIYDMYDNFDAFKQFLYKGESSK